jgi:DNA-binding winged helix-turn-helix (wHTH) protein
MPVANDLFLFGGFRLDRRNGGLFRQDDTGASIAVPIGSRALDVLTVLVGRPGELVSKDAIMNAVWPDVVIEEKNLTVQISALRRVLDDGRKDGSCI